jgi:hypothetical protein
MSLLSLSYSLTVLCNFFDMVSRAPSSFFATFPTLSQKHTATTTNNYNHLVTTTIITYKYNYRNVNVFFCFLLHFVDFFKKVQPSCLLYKHSYLFLLYIYIVFVRGEKNSVINFVNMRSILTWYNLIHESLIDIFFIYLPSWAGGFYGEYVLDWSHNYCCECVVFASILSLLYVICCNTFKQNRACESKFRKNNGVVELVMSRCCENSFWDGLAVLWRGNNWENISSMYELLWLLQVVWKTCPSNILRKS